MLGMKDKKKFWCVFRGTVRLPVMVDLSSPANHMSQGDFSMVQIETLDYQRN